MTGLGEVFARVPVRAGIAASDVATGETHTQVSPRVLTVFPAVLAMSRCDRIRFGGIIRDVEVFARLRDLRFRDLGGSCHPLA